MTSMQALKRKNEGLERYIVGLGHRVDQREKKTTNLDHTKKDYVNLTYKEPKGLTEEMINPCAMINVHNTELLDSYNLQCFRRDYRDSGYGSDKKLPGL